MIVIIRGAPLADASLQQEAVSVWRRCAEAGEGARLVRCPVLPDLRAGAGLTLVIGLDTAALALAAPATLLDGMSTVSGSLGTETEI